MNKVDIEYTINEETTLFPKPKETVKLPKRTYWTCSRVVYNLISSFSYYYILVLIAFMDVMFAPLFVILATRTNASTSEMGWIVTVGSLGNMIGAPIGAFFFHKFEIYDGDEKPKWYSLSLNRILFINTCFMVVFVFPTIIVNNFWVLLLLQLLLACTHAIGDVGANLGIGLLWREKVYPFMQLLHCVEASGYVIAPLLTAQVFNFVKTNDFLQLLIIVSFITFSIILAFLPLVVIPSPTSPREAAADAEEHEKKSGKREERMSNRRITRDWKYFEDLEEELIGSRSSINKNPSKRTQPSPKPLFDRFFCCFKFSKINNFLFTRVFTIHTLVCIVIGLVKGIETDFFQEFGNMIFTYGEENSLGTPVLRSYLLTSFWIVLMVSRLLSVFLVMLLNDAYLIIFSLAGNVLTFAVMYLFSESEIVYWIGSMSHAFFVGPLTAACFSYPQSFFGEPISSFSVAVIDFSSAFGIITSMTINSLWSSVSNILYLSGIVVFSGLLTIMVMLAGLRLYLDCYEQCIKKRRETGQPEKKKNIINSQVVGKKKSEMTEFDQFFGLMD